MSDLLSLADRVAGLSPGGDNALDVLCEVALFEQNAHWKAVRANAAGTKVIYTTVSGSEETYWPPDWTASSTRAETIAALRARARSASADGGE